jgi:hypothetical protein
VVTEEYYFQGCYAVQYVNDVNLPAFPVKRTAFVRIVRIEE